MEAAALEKALQARLPQGDDALARALRWAVEGGGKRLRPRFCLAAALAAGGCEEDALEAACAIEFLHSYTLVHDDLPAMDDDRVRRGKPSTWAAFGEATAILAGDALQALAFATAARSPRNAAWVTAALAAAAQGVVAGQAADLAAEEGVSARDRIAFVFRHKTADLFEAAVRMGARAVDAPKNVEDALAACAVPFGIGFQYADDLAAGADETGFSCLAALTRGEAEQARDAAFAQARAVLPQLPGDVSALRALLP